MNQITFLCSSSLHGTISSSPLRECYIVPADKGMGDVYTENQFSSPQLFDDRRLWGIDLKTLLEGSPQMGGKHLFSLQGSRPRCVTEIPDASGQAPSTALGSSLRTSPCGNRGMYAQVSSWPGVGKPGGHPSEHKGWAGFPRPTLQTQPETPTWFFLILNFSLLTKA